MTTEHRHVEPLTDEQETEARLRSLERDFGLLDALQRNGGRFRNVGYAYLLLNPQLIGLDAPSTDLEVPDSKKFPLVRRRDTVLPDGRVLSLRTATDPLRKTPKKEKEFLAKGTPEPKLASYLVIESGAEYEHRAIATGATAQLAEELALTQANLSEGEPFRAVQIDCYDDATATRVVEEQRDSLPWNESIELRPDGSFPVGWHGCTLTGYEKQRLADQQREDRRAKRERRDRVIRAMQREPL